MADRHGPVTVGSGSVQRTQPGARWWMYKRPDVQGTPPAPSSPAPSASPAGDDRASTPPAQGPSSDAGPALGPIEAATAMQARAHQPNNGLLAAGIAFAILALLFVGAQAGNDELSPWLIPTAAMIGAYGFGRRLTRTHADEPWLPKYLVFGMAVKLGASYARYFTITNTYQGYGDAVSYDIVANWLLAGWRGTGPTYMLDNLQKTNFVRWFTAVVYYLFGSSMIGGFFFYGALAVIGSYCWYRATVDAVPFINKRLYLLFMMFAPSIVFWPSSIGKEALMQLGLGMLAWATSLLLRGRLVAALLMGFPGGWLVWIVRVGLLAIVVLAGAFAYLLGRVGRRKGGVGSLVSRPIGMIALGFLAIFAVTQGAKFLGLPDLSLSSLEQEMNNETAQTSQGGSKFAHGTNSLGPQTVFKGAVVVLLRPFPWETHGALDLLASLETTALAGFMVYRFSSMRLALKRSRTEPYLLYCWVLLALYAVAFSSFANFGILNRERSLCLPALYALVACEPRLARALDARRDKAARARAQ